MASKYLYYRKSGRTYCVPLFCYYMMGNVPGKVKTLWVGSYYTAPISSMPECTYYNSKNDLLKFGDYYILNGYYYKVYCCEWISSKNCNGTISYSLNDWYSQRPVKINYTGFQYGSYNCRFSLCISHPSEFCYNIKRISSNNEVIVCICDLSKDGTYVCVYTWGGSPSDTLIFCFNSVYNTSLGYREVTKTYCCY